MQQLEDKPSQLVKLSAFVQANAIQRGRSPLDRITSTLHGAQCVSETCDFERPTIEAPTYTPCTR